MVGNLLLLKSKRVLYIGTHFMLNKEIIKIVRILVDKVILAYNDREAMALYEDESPDFILIDVHEPDKESIKLIQRLRQIDYAIPIIIIAVQDDPEMLMEIANLSIDAYLYKPITHEMLTHTLTHSMQRNSKESGLVLLNKNLIFNIATKELYLDGAMVNLGAREHQLLLLLIENRFRTLTKDEIEKKLWPIQPVSDSAIKKLILRIRQKMQTNLIVSVRGIGYRLDARENKEMNPMLISA